MLHFLFLATGVSALVLTPLPTLRVTRKPLPAFKKRMVTEMRAEAVDLAEDGVSLSGLVGLDEDAAFFSSAIKELLDTEWIPQIDHEKIGKEVGEIYKRARGDGVNDLNGLLLELGKGLSLFDMGDAFVGPWDVANAVSDLVLVRLGREGCESCTSTPLAPHFTDEAVKDMSESVLGSNFNRYCFLQRVLNDEESWATLSVAVGLVMGFRALSFAAEAMRSGRPGFDSSAVVDFEDAESGLEHPWRTTTSAAPPLLDAAAPLVSLLELELPEEGSDGRLFTEDMINVLYGEAGYLVEKRDKNQNFLSRAIVVQWLVNQDWLNREDLSGELVI